MQETGLAVQTNDLKMEFGTVVALAGLSLRVKQGEVFGLVGPDGAGKSTAIRLLCGILSPKSGSARVAGFDVVRDPEKVKEQIGYMSQRFSLYEDLTVQENLDFFADLYRVTKAEREPREEQLLGLSRLTQFRSRLAGQLSGGMKQKLALACTLIHRPQVLFLDEPTTGVDPVSRREFWRLLHTLPNQGVTVVFSTPYMDEAERCTTVALLSGGKLVACAAPATLKADLGQAVWELEAQPVRLARDLVAAAPWCADVHLVGERLRMLVEPATEEAAIELLVRAEGVHVASLRRVEPSLEDVFMLRRLESEG